MSHNRNPRRCCFIPLCVALLFTAVIPLHAADIAATSLTLSGTIYAGSNPLPNATVSLLHDSTGANLATATTDSTGRYSFPVNNGIYNLQIIPPAGAGFGTACVNGVFVNGANTIQNVVLVAPATMLRGTVHDLENNPLPNTIVTVYEQATAQEAGTMRTDASGRYQFPLAKGTYKIYLQGLGTAPVPRIWDYSPALTDLLVSGDTIRDFTIPLVTLSGKTLDDKGAPLAGVEVEIEAFWQEDGNFRSLQHNYKHIISDASGKYILRLLKHDYYSAMLRPPQGKSLPPTFVPLRGMTGPRTQDLAFSSQSITLSGVIRGLNAQPLPNTTISLQDGNTNYDIGTIKTDANGRYEVLLTNGWYRLGYSGSGSDPATIPQYWGTYWMEPYLTISGNTVHDVQIPFVSLRGKVTDENGDPMPGVELRTAKQLTGPALYGSVSNGSGYAKSDSGGNYAMILLPSIGYQITLIPKPQAYPQSSTFFTVDVTESTTRDFTFFSTGTLHGIVRGLEGKPLPGTKVIIYDKTFYPSIAEVTTDWQGRYQVGLPQGTYNIGLEKWNDGPQPSYWRIVPAAPAVQVSPDTTRDILLPFVTLSGRTTDSNGVPINGVELRTYDSWLESGVAYTIHLRDRDIISDPRGDYSMPLFPHTYPLTIVPPDGSGFAQTVIADINVSQSMRQNVILDYIDTRPPVILSGPRVTCIGSSFASISWLTNEPATSIVKYGAAGSLDQTVSTPGYHAIHYVYLNDLQPNTLYSARALSSDSSGNGPTSSTLFTFRTLSAHDTVPPVITEGPAISCITDSALTVEWTTNEPADSAVLYGKTESLGLSVTRRALTTAHSVTLTTLTSSTLYYVKIASRDVAGNGPTESRIISCTTLASGDNDAPLIISGPMAVNISDSAATILWETNEPATSGVSWNDGKAYGLVRDTTLAINHSLRLTGLKPSTQYNYTVSSRDASGNGPTLSKTLTFTTSPSGDTTAPVINEGPVPVFTSRHLALICWRTDELADSVIQYGKNRDLGSTVTCTLLIRRHLVPLLQLDADSRYYYRVLSSDSRGNGPTSSSIFSFSTAKILDISKPVVLESPRILYQVGGKIILYWRTDKPSDSVVDYGETLLNLRCARPERVTEHFIALTNLIPGRTYRFSISSTDINGNTVTIPDLVTPVVSTPNTASAIRFGSFTAASLADTTPPTLTAPPAILAVTNTTALIRWTTNEISDTRVQYNKKGQSLSRFAGDLAFTADHVILLTGLSPSTPYSFRAGSTDPGGNGPAWSNTVSFSTSGAADNQPPALTHTPSVSAAQSARATVAWSTSEYATTQVVYGTDANRLSAVATRSGLRASHAVELTNLKPGVRYYYQCISIDTAGNTTLTPVASFNSGATAASDWSLFQ